MSEAEYWAILYSLMAFTVGLAVFAVFEERANQRAMRREREEAETKATVAPAE
jgi:hypothetical protein